MESIVHASCQENILSRWVPFQSPNTSSSLGGRQWMAHGSSVPDQHVFVVTKEHMDKKSVSVTNADLNDTRGRTKDIFVFTFRWPGYAHRRDWTEYCTRPFDD